MKILVELSSWYPHYTSSSLGIILDQIAYDFIKEIKGEEDEGARIST